MASQQQPRRWLSFGSFSRPAQAPPPRLPAPTPTPQQPITRPQVLQFRLPAPQPTLPQGTAPITPPRPAGAPNAASAPRSPVVPTPHSAPPPRSPLAPASAPPTAPAPRSPPAPNVNSAPPSAARPPPPSAPQPRSPAAPAPAPGRAPPAAPAQSVTPAPLFPVRPPPPAAAAPRSPAALPPPITPTTRSSEPPQSQAISKSKPTSRITKTDPTSMQISPSKKPASPSRSPPPSAPSPTAVPTATVANHARTPVSSPKTISTLSKTPPQSPQVKPISHPPFPSTMFPAQIKAEHDHEPKIPTEIEQKTVLVHKITPEKANIMQKSSTDFEQRYLETTKKYIGQNEKGKSVHKKLFHSEKFGMRIITLAGENKGAILDLNTSRNKGNSKSWSNGKELGTVNSSGNEAERSTIKNKSYKSMEMQSQRMMAFINSNVQGVNNSILYDSSFTHKDPGVHLSFSRKANVAVEIPSRTT